jgi:hypothetical protein
MGQLPHPPHGLDEPAAGHASGELLLDLPPEIGWELAVEVLRETLRENPAVISSVRVGCHVSPSSGWRCASRFRSARRARCSLIFTFASLISRARAVSAVSRPSTSRSIQMIR